MKKTLPIGKAAAQLGVEVDTLRRLEREGAIRAERTRGGHRRFDVAEVARLARVRSDRRTTQGAFPPQARRSSRQAVAHPPTRVSSSSPTDRLRAVASHAPIDDPVFVDVDNDTHVEPPAEPAITRTFDRGRLESIKTYGLACVPFDIPTVWRAKVIADLERFVSPIQFPKHVSQVEATTLVSARVEEILAPYREQQAREKARRESEERARWRLVALKNHGTSYAIRGTNDWDWAAQSEARREVARELDAKAQAGWSERDVEKLVDEVLDDWEDEDDEDEDEGTDWDEDE